MFSWLKDFVWRAVAMVAAFFTGLKMGADNEKRKNAQDRLNAIREKDKIHNRIGSDPDYRKRVRDKFR